MNPIAIRRHDITVLPESARVMLRPFIPSEALRVASILGRTLALTDEEVAERLNRSRRTVQRRLTIIRRRWSHLLPDDAD